MASKRRQGSGSLVLRPRKGVPTWHGIVTVKLADGSSTREWYSLETGDRKLAEKKLARLVKDLRAGAPKEAAALSVKTETVASYFESLTHRLFPSDLANLRLHVLPTLGPIVLGAVLPAHVKSVRNVAIAAGLARGTVGKIVGALSRLFIEAIDDELVTVNPAASVKLRRGPNEEREVHKQRVILADAEFTALLGCADVDLELRMMALVARVEGGMRTSDVNRWDWSMLDRVRFERCHILRSKTSSPQPLEVPPPLRLFLRAWWERAGKPEAGAVFPVRRGDRAGSFKALRGISYAERLRKALYRAGIRRHACLWHPPMAAPKLLAACCERFAADPLYNETATTRPVDFHSFRRAFSTGLAAAGVNAQVAMHLASHSDAATHMRYVMSAPEMQRIPAAALPFVPRSLPVATIRGGESALTSVRHTGFEPVAFGSGEELSDSQCAQLRVETANHGAEVQPMKDGASHAATMAPQRSGRPWRAVVAELAVMLASEPCLTAGLPWLVAT